MSWNDYPALGERCYLETLPNGLRLRVVPKPGFAAGDGPAHCGRVVVAPIAYIEPLV